MVVEPIIKVIESSDPLLEKILERSFLDQVQEDMPIVVIIIFQRQRSRALLPTSRR
jgi:hypothetical protein